MRSTRFLFSILFFLGLAAFALHACAPGVDPVVPDTYVPPTLQVMVTINEVQDASNGKYGSSTVNLQFMTNEIIPSEFVTFGNQEYVVCNGINLNLGSFGSSVTTFSVHMIIPNNPQGYICIYHYPVKGGAKYITIFTQPVLSQLMPKLQRPVPSSSDISVSYNYDKNQPDCQVQVTAIAPNGSATGNSVAEDEGIYPGLNGGSLNVGSLSGLGNIVMTRTCTQNNVTNTDECSCPPGTTFPLVKVTYTSTASYEVSWVPPNTPATTAS